MRCLACDVILNDREAVRKMSTGEFMDLCDHCYETIREDLNQIEDEILEKSSKLRHIENDL